MSEVLIQTAPPRPRFITHPWHAFGETFENLEINGTPAPYPVVNERAVRATAGLMLIVGSFAFSMAFFMQSYAPIKVITAVFFVDFSLRIATGLTPLSPFGVLGSWLVSNQTAEWTGATQKKFAWGIGVAISLIMAVVTNMNITGALPFTMCMICMVLMWAECALGVCVGCKLYNWFVRLGILREPEYAPACPGSVCEVPQRPDANLSEAR